MTRLENFVENFKQNSPDNDDETELFLAWLKDNGPDEWHRWAIDMNWDYGLDLFRWIINQPNCDRGTALSVYYAAQPDFFEQYASIEAAQDDNPDHVGITLMLRICEMWRQGAYTTYNYRPGDAAITYLEQGADAMRALAQSVPWDVPDDLATTGIHGEPNRFEMTVDGVPVEMLEALGESW